METVFSDTLKDDMRTIHIDWSEDETKNKFEKNANELCRPFADSAAWCSLKYIMMCMTVIHFRNPICVAHCRKLLE